MTFGNAAAAAAVPDLLRLLNLDSVIRRLPDGLATELGPGRTSPLSGGEVQRLCLARVLLHWQSGELLLDEPTSAQSSMEAAQLFAAL